MDDKPIVDTPNVFGVGAMQKMLNLEDAVLLESDLRAVTPAQHAARDTATAVRRLIRELESTSASIDELAELTQEIDRLVEVLAQSDSDSSATSAKTSVAHQAHRLRERSPFIGRANPVALPLVVEFVEGGIDAIANFSTLYEGPPGCLHGGYIAGIFDEVLGAAQTYSGHAGMTGRLTVHYRSPTPGAWAEERRLFYVAATRAERELLCTWAKSRTFGERSVPRERSEFLDTYATACEALEAGIDPIAVGNGTTAPHLAPTSGTRSSKPKAKGSKSSGGRKRPGSYPDSLEATDHALFDALRAWRSERAKSADVPAFVVCNDHTLAEIARQKPQTPVELLRVYGMGEIKVSKFGGELLTIISGTLGS